MLDADEFNWTLCLPWKNIPTNWSVQARFILWISGLREGSLVDMAVKPTVHKTVKDLRAQQNPRLWIGRVECCCLPLWLILCCFPWTSHCQFLSFKKFEPFAPASAAFLSIKPSTSQPQPLHLDSYVSCHGTMCLMAFLNVAGQKGTIWKIWMHTVPWLFYGMCDGFVCDYSRGQWLVMRVLATLVGLTTKPMNYAC